MKNQQFIKTIFADFLAAKNQNALTHELIDTLNKRITRFKNNFNPVLDDFSFELRFEIYSPHRDLVEELQQEGKHHLITDNPCNHELQEQMKNELNISFVICIKALVQDWTYEFDEDGNEVIDDVYRTVGSAKFNTEKGLIRGISPSRWKSQREEGIAYLKKYLNKQLGSCDE